MCVYRLCSNNSLISQGFQISLPHQLDVPGVCFAHQHVLSIDIDITHSVAPKGNGLTGLTSKSWLENPKCKILNVAACHNRELNMWPAAVRA